MTDNSYAAPGAFPNMAVNNLTVAGATTSQGNQVVSGSQTISGGLNVTGNETIGGAVSIGGAASIGSVSSVVAAAFTGATITGGNTGTLTNGPHTGNPFTFLEISINGTVGAIPVFALT